MQTIKRLSIEDANQLLDGARARATEIGVAMCISVVDESGNLIAFERMDGAKVLSVTLSQDKAFTGAVSRRPTHEYNAICVPGNLAFGVHTSAGGRFSTVGGGLAVIAGGDVVGGIGLSSGTAEQDIDCAQAGIGHWRRVTGIKA